MTFLNKGISTQRMVLIFFVLIQAGPSLLQALPLTESLNMIREDHFQVEVRERFNHADDFYTLEQVSFGLGVVPDFSLSLSFNFLHYHGNDKPYNDNVSGDIKLSARFYLGDYAEDKFHALFLVRFTFPTGPNAYLVERWRSLALGKNELTVGPIFRIDLPEGFYLHLNVFYTFRESEAENLYSGFFLDPFKSETWEKFFGFNPMEDDTFFSFQRLKNDYFTFSLAVNTDRLYPFIPYAELYGSVRVSGEEPEEGNLPVEAMGINLFHMSLGARYFFTRDIYIGIWAVINPLWQEGFTRAHYGVETSIVF